MIKARTPAGGEQHTLHDPVLGSSSREAAVSDAIKRLTASGVDENSVRNLSLGITYLLEQDENWRKGSEDQPNEALGEVEPLLKPGFPIVLPPIDDTNMVLAGALLLSITELVEAVGATQAFEVISALFPDERGEFYTPRGLASLLAEAAEIGDGDKVYDPACGSGGLLVAAARVADLSGDSITVSGSAPGAAPMSLARMNMRMHSLDAPIGLLRDPAAPGKPLLTASLVLANPPFNQRLPNAKNRVWRYGTPPKNNANYAWLQHVLECLMPGGRASVIMANAALASDRERQIRRNIIEAGCVEAIVTLPRGLFRSTSIGVSIWMLRTPVQPVPDILLLDATALGGASSRKSHGSKRPKLTDIADLVISWRRGELVASAGIETAVATLNEVADNDFDLAPPRYIVRVPMSLHTDPARIATALRDLTLERQSAQRSESSVAEILQTLEHPTRACPSEWNTAQLGDISDIASGGTFSEDPDGSIPIVRPHDVSWNKLSVPFGRASDREALEVQRSGIQAGDILFTRTGTVGRVALATPESAGWLFSSGLLRIRPTRGIDPLYLCAYLTLPGVQDWIRRHSSGTTVDSITIRRLRSLPVRHPEQPAQLEIGRAAEALFANLRAQERVQRRSLELQHAILPALFDRGLSS